ncbi:hypothetical protein AB0F93_12475 [Micromonospora tulbaghiae]|uniref:hypothetical protein n=1 Tax=Micromonospora TaxID=1873 RepID=UPI00207C43B9|nr:hypothetical protein [Micromonospora sp. CPM1]MCO1616277.1 hypothetical protein [Micromonospora sp. CPM1]
MRLRALLVVALAALGLVVVMSPAEPAWACSCAGFTPEREERADSIVVGTVSQVTDSGVRITVDSVEKGGAEVGDTLGLKVSRSEESCGYAFRLGARYRVNSSAGETGLCAGIREISAPALAATPSAASAERTQVAGRHVPGPWWIVGGATVAVLAAGLVVAARRRAGGGHP